MGPRSGSPDRGILPDLRQTQTAHCPAKTVENAQMGPCCGATSKPRQRPGWPTRWRRQRQPKSRRTDAVCLMCDDAAEKFGYHRAVGMRTRTAGMPIAHAGLGALGAAPRWWARKPSLPVGSGIWPERRARRRAITRTASNRNAARLGRPRSCTPLKPYDRYRLQKLGRRESLSGRTLRLL